MAPSDKIKYLACQTFLFLFISQEYATCTNASYLGYMVGPVCYPSQDIRYPKTNSDVMSIIEEGILKGLKVKALGNRHSATDVICTEGIPMDMKHLQKMTFNETDNTATFGAGVILWDVTHFLQSHGRALKTAPSSGNITAVGAMGTGAHGSTLKYISTLADQAIAMTVIDGRGNIRKVSGDVMKAFRVHLGLLAVILDVTLKTVPYYKILAHNYEISDEILTDGRAIKMAKEADQIMYYWYPGLGKVVVVNWTNVDASTPGSAHVNLIGKSTRESNLERLEKMESLQKLPAEESVAILNASQSESYRGLIDDGSFSYSPFHTEDGKTLKNPAVGDWNKMVTSVCSGEGPIQCSYLHGSAKITSIDNEFSIPLEYLPEMARRLQDIQRKTPTIFFDGMILRFSAASDTYMSLSQGRDTVHVGFIAYKRHNEYEQPMAWLPAYQTFLQSMVTEMKARAHWGKVGFYYHSKDMINKKCDPAAKDAFIRAMNEYDPRGLFMNNFGRRLRGIATTTDLDPRTIHCGLQDNCVCSRDADCADSQRCGTVEGYNYRVCQHGAH